VWHADVLARGGFTLLSIVLGTVGTVASIAGLIAALRRRPESARRARKIATVRFWRSGTYHLAFDQLGELIKRWENQDFDPRNRRGFVTEFDLVRWIIQLALTCAASVVPQSLGKASLFRIGEIQRDEHARIIRIRVYSFELDGSIRPTCLPRRAASGWGSPRRIRTWGSCRWSCVWRCWPTPAAK